MLIIVFFMLLVFFAGYFAKAAKNNDRNPFLWASVGIASFLIPNLVVTVVLGSFALTGFISIMSGVICASFALNYMERKALEG